MIEYDQGFSYRQSENISGFYYCCLHFDSCDSDFIWGEIEPEYVQQDQLSNTISNDLQFAEQCKIGVPHLAYLWRQTPIKGYLAAPMYGNDKFCLPSAPWKLNSDSFIKSSFIKFYDHSELDKACE